MIVIDTQTVYLLAAFLYLMLPLNTWFALSRQRTTAIDLWCVGGLIGGFGILLISLRNTAPDILSYPLGNSLVVLSFMLRIKSVHLDLGKHGSSGKLAAFFLIFFVIYLPLYIYEEEAALGAWARLIMLLGNVWQVVVMFQISVRERSRNARAIAVAYGILALSLLVLLIMTLFGGYSIATPFSGPVDKMVAVCTSIASVLGHFSYIGLILERSSTTQAAAAAERARVEAARQKSSELAAIDRRRSLGSISSSLSHELSQPLTAINIITQLGQRKLRTGEVDPSALSDLFGRIIANIKRASEIVDQIRGFVRPAASRDERFDVRQTIEQVLRLLRQDLLKQRVRIRLDLPAEPAMVNGDPIQLSQVLMHALRNAVEACISMPEHEVTISLVVTADSVLISIQDNGPGLTADALAKVGTPFFSTKAGSLGLGLAVSRQILTTWKGEIDLENLPDGGACTCIRLPRSTESSADTANPVAA